MFRTHVRNLLVRKIRIGNLSNVRTLSVTRPHPNNEDARGLDLFKLSEKLSSYLTPQDSIPDDAQSAWTDSDTKNNTDLNVESFQRNDDSSSHVETCIGNTNTDEVKTTTLIKKSSGNDNNNNTDSEMKFEIKDIELPQFWNEASRRVALYRVILNLEKKEIALKPKIIPKLATNTTQLKRSHKKKVINEADRHKVYLEVIELIDAEKEFLSRASRTLSPFAHIQKQELEANNIKPPDRAVIRGHLDSLRVFELQERCRSYGISMGGSRADIVERIENFIFDFIGDRKGIPQNIISIDIGYRNLAYIHIDSSLRILDWRRIDLNVPDSYDPVKYAQVVNDFVETLSNRGVGIYILERQSLRHSPTTMFEGVIRSNLVEALIIGSLHGRGYSIASINPATISSYLKSEKGSTLLRNSGIVYTDRINKLKLLAPLLSGKQYNSKRYTVKKTNHVGVVKHLLKTKQTIQCPDHLEEMFLTEKKKDDLADCLIQSLVWYEWQHTKVQDIYAQILNVKSPL
ncbi:hypothetical protein K7432_000892 [Basidiobolus ranarum]|uniref:SAP domain-containing protein n=1 Tax=Basidiobolus ranarum TaxID=34480 RepID=A0ABR2WAI1_9FUNG